MSSCTYSIEYLYSYTDQAAIYNLLCKRDGEITLLGEFIAFSNGRLHFICLFYPGTYEKTVRTCLAAYKLNPSVKVWVELIT